MFWGVWMGVEDADCAETCEGVLLHAVGGIGSLRCLPIVPDTLQNDLEKASRSLGVEATTRCRQKR